MTTPAFKVGDVVWLAACSTLTVDVPCPICFGRKAVTLILGNGDQLRLECDYCNKGYIEPRGVIVEHRLGPVVDRRIIDRVSVSATDVEYQCDCSILKGENVFATEAAAMARATELVAERTAENQKRADVIKHMAAKTYSWNAGYHLREAKALRERADRHERKASLCKQAGKAAIS